MSAQNRNRFKYECGACGWTGFFNKHEFARRSRPCCSACGSTRLEPSRGSEAGSRCLEHQTVSDFLADDKWRGYFEEQRRRMKETQGF